MSRQGSGHVVYGYARVLLDLVKSNSDSISDEVRAMLCVFKDEGVREFFSNPIIPAEAKIEILRVVKETCSLSDVLVNFMCVVAEDGFCADIVSMLEKFLVLLRRKSGRFNLEIVTAAPITGAEKQKIRNLIKVQFGEPESITTRVDQEILGGYIVRGDSFVLDASYIGQLRELNRISREAAFNI